MHSVHVRCAGCSSKTEGKKGSITGHSLGMVSFPRIIKGAAVAQGGAWCAHLSIACCACWAHRSRPMSLVILVSVEVMASFSPATKNQR